MVKIKISDHSLAIEEYLSGKATTLEKHLKEQGLNIKRTISGKELSKIVGHISKEYEPFYQILKEYQYLGDPRRLGYCGCYDWPINVSESTQVYHLVRTPDKKVIKLASWEGAENKETWGVEHLLLAFVQISENGRFPSRTKDFDEYCEQQGLTCNKLGDYNLFLKENNLIELFSYREKHCHGMITVMDAFRKKSIHIPEEMPLHLLKRTEDSGFLYDIGYGCMGLKLGNIKTKKLFYCLGGDGFIRLEFVQQCLIGKKPLFKVSKKP